MENKTLKPGQLATVKSKLIRAQGKALETRAIVRASKKVTHSCLSCYLQNDYLPCHRFMPVEKCREMFGPDIFPIVVYEKTVFNT